MKYPRKNVPIPLGDVLELCTQLGMLEEREAIEKDPPPKSFRWDGASMCPDEFGGVNTDPASLPHDIRYWAGYKNDKRGRLRADFLFGVDLLTKCKCSAELTMIGFNAVHVGGNITGTPWRYGFGR